MAAIDVRPFIEHKGKLSYVSWVFAVEQLMRVDPEANWVFHDPQLFGETMMVSCTVTAFGKPVTMHLPVMDHKNAAVKNPDAVVVNKNMMRCLVKAIACHGLGLNVYAGEDLPMERGPKISATDDFKVDPDRVDLLISVADAVNERMAADDIIGAFDEYSGIIEPDEKGFVWKQLDSKIRSALRKHGESLKGQ
ncbi:MAG: DUF1071 domain-containing protein [Burkholderiaceae bacterium]|nr:DUF1071 domain-containing protein [Burkholderiaceae bacterium]